MKQPLTILSVLLGVLVACIVALKQCTPTSSSSSLTLYCAAGLQAPIEEIIQEYERQTGTSVHVIYNGSGALLSQLQLGQGDLYLPANQSYIATASDHLLGTAAPVVEQQAVIAVHQSNQTIKSLADLNQPGLKISFAENSAAIGKYAKNLLQQLQLWDSIHPNIVVYKPTVNGVIEDVALRSADATIAWKNTALNFPHIRIIEDPALNTAPQHATISILKSSQSKEAAKHFITFLTTATSSQETFKKYHYTPAQH